MYQTLPIGNSWSIGEIWEAVMSSSSLSITLVGAYFSDWSRPTLPFYEPQNEQARITRVIEHFQEAVPRDVPRVPSVENAFILILSQPRLEGKWSWIES